MLMHAENSSLQDSSAQRRTDPVLPGTGVPPTASQTTALPHQCRKYLAKTCQDCHHTLPRPPNLPATHLPTSLTSAHPPAHNTPRSSRDNTTLNTRHSHPALAAFSIGLDDRPDKRTCVD